AALHQEAQSLLQNSVLARRKLRHLANIGHNSGCSSKGTVRYGSISNYRGDAKPSSDFHVRAGEKMRNKIAPRRLPSCPLLATGHVLSRSARISRSPRGPHPCREPVTCRKAGCTRG